MKLEAISKAGFDSIELGMPDLQAYAQQKLGSSFSPLSDEDGSGDLTSLIRIAGELKQLCKDLNLQILCLQPFSQFEGYTDDDKREGKFRKAKVWMDVMEALGTDMLQVGSTDDKESTSDREVIVQDLTELADLAAKRGMRIGYEVNNPHKNSCRKMRADLRDRCGAGQHIMILGAISGRSAKRVSLSCTFAGAQRV
jgi:sugar phosphate isomerase/epimerase